MVQSGRITRKFKEDDLPSSLFIGSIYGENNFKNHIQEIERNISSNNSEEIISTINKQLDQIYADISNAYSIKEESKCCRNINYYFDLLYSIIKSSGGLSKDIPNNLISQIETKLKNIPNISDKNKCKGETDLDSIRRRCILKHLQDLKIDKNFILSFPQDYKTYLRKKWDKIIKYINPNNKLYIKIENDFMGIIEQYNNFLESSDLICNTKLDDISIDDITISTNWDSLMNSISLEKFTNNNYEKGCYNKNYIKILKNKASSIQRINNILSSGIAILGIFLILVLICRFSPLRSFLRGCTKKKVEVDENMNEEVVSELYDDSENERTSISYHSVFH
ncbi:PIR Superfamily Protein [Plasmodium ovale wallikeri]|uniref:PIR Superfamily Protein n=3 Tax=Plasmodium ovale TaxID=36330 RepID=A0A1A8WC53_PLAOA|nr:PIR Superfamily Protein [Plasmodium ovale curtisi]SBT56407.1 PIR Superfamily Protein [Plasmodium ovale wallikeri]SBT72950.1 PIR protein [Plasmodium ovale]